MPLSYSPAGCLDSALAFPPSYSFQAFSLALFVLPLVLVPLGWFGWWCLLDMPRIRIRSFPANFVLGLGLILCGAETGLRRSMLVPVACWIQPWLFLSFVVLVGTATFVRVFAAHSLTVAERMAKNYEEINFDELMISATSESGSIVSSQHVRFMGHVSSLVDVIHLLVFDAIPGNPQRLLLALQGATRARNLLLISAILYLPALATMTALIVLVPVYHSSCINCAFTLELLIAYAVMACSYICIVVPMSVRLFALVDHTGVLFEIKVTALAAPPILLGIVLLASDPMNYEQENVFSWEWFLFLGVFIMWCIWTPLQLLLAWKDRTAASTMAHKSSGHNVDLEKAMLDDQQFKLFLAYCETVFQVENARFLRDVALWKKVYFERSHEFRSMRARAIAKLYLAPQGGLELNVAHDVKARILQKLANDIDVELFEDALRQVSDMLRFSTWVDFRNKQRKGTSEFLVSAGALAATSEARF